MNIFAVCAVIAAALIMTLVYSRTRHPVLYAFIGTAAGCCTLVLMKTFLGGSDTSVSFLSAAAAAIFGVPGAVLSMVLPLISGR